MKPATKVVLVTLGLAAAVGACSRGLLANRQAEAPRKRDVPASALAEGHALVQQQQYDKAIDAFVRAAGDSRATSDAVAGAVAALDLKVGGFRMPDQLKEAAKLWKRLPANKSREVLRLRIQHYLLSAVVLQTQQADALLADRRKFVNDMYANDQGDVRSTDASGRVITEAEILHAESQMKGLQQPYSLMDLYIKHEDVAAALQRFAENDRDVLATETVTDSGLAELDDANSQLADALWPVHRRLDKLLPGWRTQ